MQNLRQKQQFGFTIVELLIVIVVIGILAAITIVAFNGVSQKARVATIQSDLEGSAKQLESYKIGTSTNEQYPADLSTAALKASAGTTYSYNINTDSNTYCLSATNGGTTYSVVSGNSTPQTGDCTTAGLVGWWKLNNDGTDSSSANNVATNTGATSTTGQNGQANSAYAFNGSVYMTAAGNSLPSGSADRSVFAWVYMTANPSGAWSMVDTWGSNSGTGTASSLAISSSGSTGCVTSNNTIGGPSIVLNSWNLVGCVVSNGGKTANVYRNTTSFTGTFPTTLNTTAGSSNYIGRYSTANYLFVGSIDDVRIYNRALTSAEVAALYAAGAQ